MERQISSRKRKYEGDVSDGAPKSKLFQRDADFHQNSKQSQLTNVSPNKWAPHMTTPSRCMANDRLKKLKETLEHERKMNIVKKQQIFNSERTWETPTKTTISKEDKSLARPNTNTTHHFQKQVTGLGHNKSNNLDGDSRSKENSPSLKLSVQDRIRNAKTSPSASRISSYKTKEQEGRHDNNSWNNNKNKAETITSNYKPKEQQSMQNPRDYFSWENKSETNNYKTKECINNRHNYNSWNNKSETITTTYKVKEQERVNNRQNYNSWNNKSETITSSYKAKEQENTSNYNSQSRLANLRKSLPTQPTERESDSLTLTIQDKLKQFTSTSLNNSRTDSSLQFEDNDLDMDWSPICEEEVACHISIVRQKLLSEVDRPCSISNNLTKENVSRNIKTLHIVVDSNVFIHKLSIISSLLNISFEDGSTPVIFVPWMVVQEIDYIKDGYGTNKQPNHQTLQNRCRKAVQFIHNCLITKKPNFRCETAKEATDLKLKITNPDDSILSCCFNLAVHNKIILLSSDTNLRSKALINNLDSCHPDEILKRMAQKRTKRKEDNIKKISQNLSFVCSFIIHAQSDPADINSLGQLPWEFNVCIKFMKDNYGSMFKGRIQKQCQKVINDIYEILFGDSIPDENIFIDLCFALLLYIKTGIASHERLINQAIEKLKKFKEAQ